MLAVFYFENLTLLSPLFILTGNIFVRNNALEQHFRLLRGEQQSTVTATSMAIASCVVLTVAPVIQVQFKVIKIGTVAGLPGQHV